jgi:NAD(P)-dependent dehydrogenase (short-subunit alcohol dehydrogenase family)
MTTQEQTERATCPTPRLRGKVAVVSGAAQGIGQALATRLAEDGAAVALVEHTTSSDETKKAIDEAGGEAIVVKGDVSSADDVAGIAEQVRDQYDRVDILVNNAGIYPMQSFLEMTYEEWREMFAVNIDSVFHMCKAFVGGMAENGWGRVINLSSTSYIAGMANYTHYNGTKAAVVGFTRSLAVEFGPQGVTANSVAPSLVRTPTTNSGPQADGMFEGFLDEQQVKIVQEPEHLAGAVSWLASDDAEMVTGQTILVDGGWRFL